MLGAILLSTQKLQTSLGFELNHKSIWFYRFTCFSSFRPWISASRFPSFRYWIQMLKSASNCLKSCCKACLNLATAVWCFPCHRNTFLLSSRLKYNSESTGIGARLSDRRSPHQTQWKWRKHWNTRRQAQLKISCEIKRLIVFYQIVFAN